MRMRRGCFAAWLCLLAAGCVFSRDNIFPALAGATFLAAALSAIVLWREKKSITLQLSVSGSENGTKDIQGLFTAVYGGRLPYVTVEAVLCCKNCLTGDKQQIFLRRSLTAGNPEAVEFQLHSRYCGRLEFTLEAYRIFDLFGLIPFTRGCALREAALVLPQEADSSWIEELVRTPDPEGVDFSENRPGFDPSETFAIRDYQQGDRLKMIHWKLSGKLDQLMVKEAVLPLRSCMQILMETCFPVEDEEQRKELIDKVCAYTIALSEQLADEGVPYQLGYMNYKENYFHNDAVTGSDSLPDILPSLLSAEVVYGTETVLDKYYEEAAGQIVSGIIVINHEIIQ